MFFTHFDRDWDELRFPFEPQSQEVSMGNQFGELFCSYDNWNFLFGCEGSHI